MAPTFSAKTEPGASTEMLFPFVTRSHHEAVVKSLKDQITALAKLLYPQGVPEEFQLLVGIHIEENSKPVTEEKKPEAPDEKLFQAIKDEKEAFRAKLRAARRTSPSRIGPMIAAEAQRRTMRDAELAHPAQTVFANARQQVK